MNVVGGSVNSNFADEFLKIFKISLGEGVSYTQGERKGYDEMSDNYIYPKSLAPVTTSSSVQVNSLTKLSDLGFVVGTEYDLFAYAGIFNGSYGVKSFSIQINSNTTIGNLVNSINSTSNLQASFTDGKLTVSGKQVSNENNAFITRFSTVFKNIFKLGDAGSGKTFQTKNVYENTQSSFQTRQGPVAIGTDTNKTLRQLGLTSNGTISMNNTDGKVTWKIITPDMKISDFNRILTDFGVTATLSGSKLTIGSLNDSEWVETISDNLRNALKLKNTGTGFTYEIIGNAAYENTSSRTIKTITTHTASGTTRLEQIDGFNGGNGNIIIQNEAGVMETVYINSTSTLNEFFSQIAAYGLTGSVNASGVVSINGKGRASILTASGGSNLVSLLKLSQTKASKTVTVNTTTAAISSTARILATSDTQLGNLEYSNGTKLTFDSNGFAALVLQTKTHDGLLKNMTVNFTKTSTLGSVIQTLAGQGLNASVEASGMFSVNTDKLSDFSISGTLGAYLMGANYNKCYETRSDVPLMSVKTMTSTVAATRETKLADLGVTAGEYNIYKNGVKYTALISSDETFGTFMDTLASFGIQAGLVNNGTSSRLVIHGSGNSYIAKSNNVSNSSNIVEKLFGAAAPDISNSYTGTQQVSNTSTSTVSATGATALSSLGVTSGEYYIYKDGVKYTALISSNETLGSLMDTLKSFGFQTALVDDGGSSKLVVIGSGDSYIEK